MIFSQVKEYDIFTNNKWRRIYFYYSFRINSIVSIVSLTNADPTSGFLTSLTSLFLSKTIKSRYVIS